MDSLNILVAQFIKYLEYEKRYSANTIANYSRTLSVYTNELDQLNLNSWNKVSIFHIKKIVFKFNRNKLSSRSIANKLAILRSFYSYLVSINEVEFNFVKSIKAPKHNKILPKNLDVDSINQLLDIDIKKEDNLFVLRDVAMLELFYATGIRLSELANLNVNDINFKQQQILIKGKGNKERIVFFNAKTKKYLQNWLKVRKKYLDNIQEIALFISNRKKRLHVRSIQKRLEFWATKQNLQNTLNPHKLRHSFATHMLESSNNLRAVQELLGHENISTTQIYTHLDFNYLSSVYDKFHPRSKKK